MSIITKRKSTHQCFLGFRKALDSVWHDGLLYKLLPIKLRVYTRILLPLLELEIAKRDLLKTQEVCAKALLFNLYVNDLAFTFNNVLSDPFVLPNGTKLNFLFYADDLIKLVIVDTTAAPAVKRLCDHIY